MKRILLTSASAFALCAVSPAFAHVSATLSADYFNLQGPSWVENHFRLTGDAAVPLGWYDLSLQGSAQYEYANSAGCCHWSEGTFAVTPFWTGQDTRVAL